MIDRYRWFGDVRHDPTPVMSSEELHTLLPSDSSQGLTISSQGLTEGLTGSQPRTSSQPGTSSQPRTSSQGGTESQESQLRMQVDRPQAAPIGRQLGRQLTLDCQPGRQLAVDSKFALNRPRDAPLPLDRQLGALSVDNNDDRAAKRRAVDLRADWMPSGTQHSDDEIEDSSQ